MKKFSEKVIFMRFMVISIYLLCLSSCGTAIAIVDTVGEVAVYGAKTVVKAVDALTPDIVNKKTKD